MDGILARLCWRSGEKAAGYSEAPSQGKRSVVLLLRRLPPVATLELFPPIRADLI